MKRGSSVLRMNAQPSLQRVTSAVSQATILVRTLPNYITFLKLNADEALKQFRS